MGKRKKELIVGLYDHVIMGLYDHVIVGLYDRVREQEHGFDSFREEDFENPLYSAIRGARLAQTQEILAEAADEAGIKPYFERFHHPNPRWSYVNKRQTILPGIEKTLLGQGSNMDIFFVMGDSSGAHIIPTIIELGLEARKLKPWMKQNLVGIVNNPAYAHKVAEFPQIIDLESARGLTEQDIPRLVDSYKQALKNMQ